MQGLTPTTVPAPRRRPVWLKLLVVAVDLVCISAGLILAFFLRNFVPMRSTEVLDRGDHVLLGVLALPLWTIAFAHYRLYRTRHIQSRIQEFKRIANASLASLLCTSFIGSMLRLNLARLWLILAFPTTVVLVTLGRGGLRQFFGALRSRGRLLRQVVIVGKNLEGDALCHMLENDRALGYEVVGFVDDEVPAFRHDPRPVVPHLGDVVSAVRATGATGALIATTSVDLETANRLARQLTESGIHVELSSSLRDIAAERLTLHTLGRCPVVYVEPVRRRGWRAVAKRSFDTVCAGLGLVLVAPALLLAALAIKLDSPGPVFFRQQRVGRERKPFEVLKLRTMVVNAEDLKADLLVLNEAGGPLFKMRKDPRVTRVGRILRKYSIDELPQLWNVIKGEMSLVGPRPALPSEVEGWDESLHRRVRVRPGLTGMWQVGGRSEASFADYVRLDLYYVDNWSFWTDLAIIAKTIPVLVLRRGAY